MQTWGITDPGCVRSQNQDTYQIEQLDRSTTLCIVCDGMGGARSGNVASSLAVDVFIQEVRNTFKSNMSQADWDRMLESAVKLANFTVYDQSHQFEEFYGMGTTLVAALIRGRRVTVVNVGDSRVYRVNPDGIDQITVDHSLVQLMVSRGELSREQARRFPGKNYITRAVGTESTVQCDIFHLDVERGDCILLCSDGLTNTMDDQEILFEVVHGVNKEDCCQHLLDVAKSRGAPDNVTGVMVLI